MSPLARAPPPPAAALAAGLGRPTPLGLAVLPTRPGLLGGRAVLDFVVQVRALDDGGGKCACRSRGRSQAHTTLCVAGAQAAAAALRRWGRGGAEEKVVRHALWAVRALTNNPTAARAIVMSAAWEQLASGALAMVRGDAAAAGTLALLPPETQGELVALVLSPTRCIGAEAAAYEAAEELSGADVKEQLQVRCEAGAALHRLRATTRCSLQDAHTAAATGRPLPEATPVLARWHAYFSAFASAIAGTLSGLAPDLLKPPISPATTHQVRQSFCV